ncbi:hypothetical protein [Micromonospora zhanjiangensis]
MACWGAATVALATGCRALVRRGRTRTAMAALVLGGLAVVELACAVYLSVAPVGTGTSVTATLGAYPALLVGAGTDVLGDRAGELTETLKILPQLLTVCTAFALVLAATGTPEAADRP